MTKPFLAVAVLLAAGFTSSGEAFAQAPATGTPPAPAASTPAKPPSGTKSPTASQSSATPATPKTGAAAGARRPATAAAPLKTAKEKASYAIGENIGKGLQKDGVDVDAASLARGIRDAIAGNKSLLTEEEAKAAIMALATEVRAKQQVKMEQLGLANKKVGDAFLATNKTKDGVVTLPSGLQYKVLKAGSGPKPSAADKVECNYRGTLIAGTEFDSSYKRGQPVTFQVGEVIKGWSEALQLMPVGSKWQLFVPSDLAYGDRAPGQEIGPNSTLIFEVELLSIVPKSDAPKADSSK
jgi:FKBP-type peptidyl-prolyl cis-trans isomerase FklB